MFEKTFELRYFEMNKHGMASAATMLTLLEETASDHCSEIGYGLFDLLKNKVGWVLLSGYLEIYRYPQHKEKITIKTWLSTYTEIKGIRENLVFDEKGEIIARGKGLWVFFDINKRRPTRIFKDIIERWSFTNEESVKGDVSKKIKPVDSEIHHKEFLVHRFDIDMNQHVNNIRYLHWVMESIPEEILDHYYLFSIDGRFISEAHLGETVLSFTEEGDEPNSFVHTIKVKGSNKVCATAKTVWKPM
jgi:medium-chain acyl-[acyl-carrier-protein] hydrolase